MRTRVRLLALATSLFVLPVLVLGVVRASAADQAAREFRVADELTSRLHKLEIDVERSKSALVRYEAQPEVENEQQVTITLDEVSRAILDVEAVDRATHPGAAASQARGVALLPDGAKRLGDLKSTTRRVRVAVDEALHAKGGAPDPALVRRASLALDTLGKGAQSLGDDARRVSAARAKNAETLVSRAERDQLVLTILFLIGAAALLLVGPGFVLAPLSRMRAFAQRIESGRVQEAVALGNDEVAELTRVVRSALKRANEASTLRAGKISEMTNVLHALVDRIDDAVIVIGDDGKIDYISNKAAEILGKQLHNLRGEHFENVMFAPALNDAIARALKGDVDEEPAEVVLESADGRVSKLKANFGTVSDRAGSIARVVVVLRA